jgi:hypothetical protein
LRFSELAGVLDGINRSSLVGRRVLAEDLISAMPRRDRPGVVAILAGENLSGDRVQRDIVIRAISRASGYSRLKVEEILRESAGLPAAAEVLLGKRRQLSFTKDAPTVHDVISEVERITDPAANRRSILLHLTTLLSACEPSSARIVVAICLGESPRYLADSVLLDLVAELDCRDPDGLRSTIGELGWRKGLE